LTEELKSHVERALPPYMVPSVYVIMERLPMNANEKIDKKALPLPEEQDLPRKEYVAPRNELEEKVCKIFQEVLGVERVGIYDDFFELGGHSLLVVKMSNEIRSLHGSEVPIIELYSRTTPAMLAEFLLQERSNAGPELVMLFPDATIESFQAGRQLYGDDPLFKALFDEVVAAADAEHGGRLLEIVTSEAPESTAREGFSDMFGFALEYALARCIQLRGASPQALMGCGIGEYVAACVAGVFAVEDALRLISLRPAADRVAAAAASIPMREPDTAVISTVTGGWAAQELTRPEHWMGHANASVMFSSGLAELLTVESRVFLEVGPGKALTKRIRMYGAAAGRTVVPLLAYDESGSSNGNLLEGAVEHLRSLGVIASSSLTEPQ
jgi:malonyl CoA-acyl carrier protein transacylase/acyl carrier protein